MEKDTKNNVKRHQTGKCISNAESISPNMEEKDETGQENAICGRETK